LVYGSVGSKFLPGDDQLMLAVGGDLDISSGNTTSVQVGRVPEAEGRYMVQGTLSDPAKVDVGIEDSYNLSSTPANNFGNKVSAGSEELRDASPTGDYTWDGGEWEPLIFEGDGFSDLQVFEISSSTLSNIKAIDFNNIPENASIVVNVDGDDATVDPALGYSLNGVLVQPMTEAAGHFAAHTLWNFHEASNIEIGIENGSDGQFLGSLLVGNSEGTLKTFESTNGRVYTAGDFETRGEGIEIHNYPFVGYLPFSCIPEADDNGSGTFQISKEISGVDSDLFDADDEFEVTYTVDGEEAGDSLIITADGAIVDGPEFDEGTEVVFDEVTPEDVNGAIFKDFTIEIDGQETDTLVVEEDANHEIIVTNRYVPTGGFTLHKRVDAEVDIPEGTEFTFDVTIGDHTELVTLIDSESHTFRGIEFGTEITIAENSPDLDGFSWAGVRFQAPSITDRQVDGNSLSCILAGEGSDHTINAINSFTADEPATGSFALQKEVDAGGDFPDDTTFDFDVTIGDDDPEAISLSAGEFSDSFTDIDEGTEVTIAETTPSVEGYDWNSVTFSGGRGIQEGNSYTFTVDANDELTIIATNSFTEQEELTGSFNIHKELEGEGAELIDPETRFDVAYATSDGDDGTLTILANGNSVDGPELPEG